MRARAVQRIAAAETELADAHDLLERCDTALECTPATPRDLLRATLRQASAELAAAPSWVRAAARGVSGVEFAPPSNPDSIREIARRAGASDPVLVREADGVRLTIGPVDDPVAIGRAVYLCNARPFLGSRQVLIAPGVAFRFERRPGVQLGFPPVPPLDRHGEPQPPLPPLSTVGPAGNRGAV